MKLNDISLVLTASIVGLSIAIVALLNKFFIEWGGIYIIILFFVVKWLLHFFAL